MHSTFTWQPSPFASNTIKPPATADSVFHRHSRMEATLSSLSLSLLLLFLTSVPFSSATNPDNRFHLSSTARFPKLQAEKLIRGLNLFPKESINTAAHDPLFVAPKIVEKRFHFPHLDYTGPSVQELGHHAGYYRLPHSKGAR